MRIPEGFIHRVEYCFSVLLDSYHHLVNKENNDNNNNNTESLIDAGSKPWLLQKALSVDNEQFDGIQSNNDSNLYSSQAAIYYGIKKKKRGVNDNDYDDDTDKLLLEKNDKLLVVDEDNDYLPEDKFHIKLPSNVDKYTGVPLDSIDNTENQNEIENMELPEDRFHKKDASSQFLISQREQAVKDKWTKHAK